MAHVHNWINICVFTEARYSNIVARCICINRICGRGLVSTTPAVMAKLRFPKKLPHKPQYMGTFVIWPALGFEIL